MSRFAEQTVNRLFSVGLSLDNARSMAGDRARGRDRRGRPA